MRVAPYTITAIAEKSTTYCPYYAKDTADEIQVYQAQGPTMVPCRTIYEVKQAFADPMPLLLVKRATAGTFPIDTFWWEPDDLIGSVG